VIITADVVSLGIAASASATVDLVAQCTCHACSSPWGSGIIAGHVPDTSGVGGRDAISFTEAAPGLHGTGASLVDTVGVTRLLKAYSAEFVRSATISSHAR
jgi:hypothetical protein